MSETVYLGIGGNLPGTLAAITRLKSTLSKEFPSTIRHSKIYSTAPYKGSSGGQFYNCCACFEENSSDPRGVMNKLLAWEKDLGRVRAGERWESRLIDIDILLYGSNVIKEEGLVIPHYDLASRDFFLLPLMELAPDILIPPLNLGPSELLQRIPAHLRTMPVVHNC